MHLLPTTLLNPPTGLALLFFSLFVAAIGVLLVVSSNLLEEPVDSTAWWRRRSMDSTAVIGNCGRLVGGSRRPSMLSSCQQCDAADPPHRCAVCASVAYCSRACQQKHWGAQHKLECRKLRDIRQQEEQARHATPVPSGAGEDASAAEAERPNESNSTPPVPRQVLYPSDAYAGLVAAPPQRKHPLGLQNVGNSCYANSLLQALLATPPLAAYLISGQHRRGCIKPSPSDWCVLCELEKLATAAYDRDSARVLNPKSLLRNVKRLGKQFSFGRQEDSHELYVRLLEAVEAVQLLEAGGRRRYDLRTRETTLMHHVFAGYTRTAVECAACGHVSRTYECCTSLTLEVSPRAASLEAALRSFAAVERLDGVNRYKCDGCKAYVAADKSTRVEAAPHVLQICLKRFGLGRYGKITSRLSFPEELDLAPYMAAGALDSDPVRYHLYAVVVHIDWGRSTDYGHYISYVRCGGAWFLCDDAAVTRVAAAKVLAAGAYLLFYQREAPRRVAAAGEATQAGQASLERPQTAAVATRDLLTPQSSETSASPVAASAVDPAEAEQAGDSEGGLPQHLHASSPDGDQGPTCSSGMPATDMGSEQLSQEQRPCRQQGDERSDHSGLQQEAEVAAESARAEVEALMWAQHADHSCGSSGAATVASSPSSGSLGMSPGTDPFYLLGPGDATSGSEASRAAGSESDDDGWGAAQDDDERMAAAAAELSAWQLPQEQGRARGGSSSLDHGPVGTQAGQQDRVEQLSTQQLCERRLQPQQHPEKESALPKGAKCTAFSSAEGADGAPCTPKHRASIGEMAGQAVLRLSVDLPGVQHEEHVQWRMAPPGSSNTRQQLQLRANRFLLQLPLPVPVADGQAAAEWVAAGERLTITVPLS